MYEHKHGLVRGFASRYKITRLVYYGTTNDIRDAIAREKDIKGWLHAKKVALIESTNPTWEDLSADWYDEADSSPPAQNDNQKAG